MVVGNVCGSDKLKEGAGYTYENKSIQQQPPAVVNETNNTESVTLLVDNAADLKVQGPTDMNPQGEVMVKSLVTSSDNNNSMTPLSNLSHPQFPSTRPRIPSASIPTGEFSEMSVLILLFDIYVIILFLTYNIDRSPVYVTGFRKSNLHTPL